MKEQLYPLHYTHCNVKVINVRGRIAVGLIVQMKRTWLDSHVTERKSVIEHMYILRMYISTVLHYDILYNQRR